MKALLPEDPRWIGPHRMIAVIGRGGMGRVLLGRTPTGRLVAIKQIHPGRADDFEFRVRFHQEVASTRRLTGAYTAAVVDSEVDAENPWLATEYIAAPDLQSVVEKCGPLPLAGLRLLATGLASALIEVHRAALVHRDLKPGNVLLTPEGPRLIDFGIARAQDADTGPTMSGAALGSPAYMAPEQAEGKPVTAAADIFAVGALLTMAATGSSPFPGDSTPQIVYGVVHGTPDLRAVPHSLRDLVESCLAKDPVHRPSARQLLDQAERIPADSVWPHRVQDFIAAHRADAEWWASTGEREARYRDELARIAMRRRATLRWATAAVVTVLVFAGAVMGVHRWAATGGHAQPMTDPSLALTAAELRMLDPCKVIDRAIAGKLGTRIGDPEWLLSGGCGITVVDAAKQRVSYGLDVDGNFLGVEGMTPTGRAAGWTPIFIGKPVDSLCDSELVTQTGGQVTLKVYAEMLDSMTESAAACAAAEEAMIAVVGQLTVNVPLRNLPSSSVLRVDPCGVLDSALARGITGALGSRRTTPHACSLTGHNGSITTGLIESMRPDQVYGTKPTAQVGKYTAIITSQSDQECDLTYMVHPTTDNQAEQVQLSVTDFAKPSDPCTKTEQLLADIIARLPKS
ncbi:serine/threonine-protein kinase [Nocardia sp. NPDC101769]|uniref:serine/threonine-protein kinase n=1 Tax=Nocardia sp. NPDC101769 TaxID=3364333 RepID=UPI0038252507